MPRNRQIDAKVTITFTQNVSIIVRDGDDENEIYNKLWRAAELNDYITNDTLNIISLEKDGEKITMEELTTN